MSNEDKLVMSKEEAKELDSEIIVYSGDDKEEEQTLESRFTLVNEMKTDERGITLLKDMYEIFSPSGREHAMLVFVSKWLQANGIEHKIDSMGNIYAQNKVRGSKRIIINAHMDTVASGPADIQVTHIKKDVIISSSNNQVIGADDKNGLWCVLRLLTDKEVDTPLTALICVEEESGCNGSQFAMDNHADYFEDCVFNMTIDRRGDTDIIIENFDITLCSDKMQKKLSKWGKPFGLKNTTGSISDVSNIVENLKINGINLFAGYHDAHSGSEHTSMLELIKSYTFQKYLLPELHKHFMLNPDDVEFKDFNAYKSITYYGRYNYGDISSYGGQVRPYKMSEKKSFGTVDEMSVIEAFEDCVDELDRLANDQQLYYALIDADYELSHSKKSLKILQAYYLMPEICSKLSYYFNVTSNQLGDAVISVKEIVQFATEEALIHKECEELDGDISPSLDKPKYTGIDKRDYDSEWGGY